MRAIEVCRTAVLGGHKDQCDHCAHVEISYNCCRNRHCPQCQTLRKEKWIEARSENLLPIEYFHVVFTLPSELNHLALLNQRVLYDLLFRSASETLTELAQNPKHLGATVGLIGILHTWGQNLMDHPPSTVSSRVEAYLPMAPGNHAVEDFFFPSESCRRYSEASFWFFSKIPSKKRS
jgi:hypothetical protein